MEAPSPSVSKVSKIIKFKEFYNFFEEYYLKLSHNDNEELIIICYNIVKLDGICYETKMQREQFCILNSIFKQCKKVQDIYELILDSIKDNQITLSFNKDNNLIFSFTITDIKSNSQKVDIPLVNNSNNNTKEYINILSTQIINLRNDNTNNNKEIKQLKDEIKQLSDKI